MFVVFIFVLRVTLWKMGDYIPIESLAYSNKSVCTLHVTSENSFIHPNLFRSAAVRLKGSQPNGGSVDKDWEERNNK